jgi:hypothetical protein
MAGAAPRTHQLRRAIAKPPRIGFARGERLDRDAPPCVQLEASAGTAGAS